MSTKYIIGSVVDGISLPSPIGTGDEIGNVAGVQALIDAYVATGDTISVSDTTQVIPAFPYHTQAETTHADSVASLADGEYVGQRKLITLITLGEVGDDLTLSPTNIHNASGTQATSVVFDAADEFLLVEWTGVEWQAIYTTATIATA